MALYIKFEKRKRNYLWIPLLYKIFLVKIISYLKKTLFLIAFIKIAKEKIRIYCKINNLNLINYYSHLYLYQRYYLRVRWFTIIFTITFTIMKKLKRTWKRQICSILPEHFTTLERSTGRFFYELLEIARESTDRYRMTFPTSLEGNKLWSAGTVSSRGQVDRAHSRI